MNQAFPSFGLEIFGGVEYDLYLICLNFEIKFYIFLREILSYVLGCVNSLFI